MHPFAAFRCLSRRAAATALAAVFVAGVTLSPGSAHAASPGVEGLINKLPDPEKLSKSPLETAIASQDPMFKDPEFLRFAASAKRDPRSALGSLRILTTKYPDKPALQFVRGAYALLFRQYAEAETSFRAVIAVKGPAAALGWYGMAGVHAAQQRPTEAASALRQSVTLQPKFALGWMFLAGIEAKQGHAVEGADDARRVTMLQPKFAPGWAVLAYCESNQKKYDAAIADYRHAISNAPKYAFAYEGLGICYALSNRPADAVGPLKSALALTPSDYLAATELGYCYLRSGQYEDSLKACHQAVAARPGYGKAWDVMGLCYRHEGKKREALAAFRKAIEDSPNDPTVRTHFAEATQAAAHP